MPATFAQPQSFLLAPASPSATAFGARDRRVLGVACIVGSTICFPLSDVSAQSLMGSLPSMEVAWLRYCVFFLAVLPLLSRGPRILATARPGLQILRGTMTALSTLTALVAFKYLPVADTTAVAFIAPVFVTALAMIVLKEKVGPRRWAAAFVAFLGVMIIVQPGAASFQRAALLPLVGAGCSALAVICTRLNRGDDPRTTTLYTAIVGTALLTVVASFDLVTPSAAQWPVIMTVGVFGAVGTVLQVVGYRLAPASLLAPFSYLQLIWVGGLSFLVSGAVPHLSMILGASVIAASALYTLYRERVRGVA